MPRANKVFWLDRGPFPLYFGFCPNKRAWDREMKRLKLSEPYPEKADGRASHFTAPGNKRLVIVTVGHHIDKDADASEVVCLLLHEGVHVWQALREEIKEDSPSAEFEAYTIQHITRQLCYAYQKTRRKFPDASKLRNGRRGRHLSRGARKHRLGSRRRVSGGHKARRARPRKRMA